jgi:ATP-dependent exoDNAse (exonuclease V) beta subunit
MTGPRISYSAAQDLKLCSARYMYSFSDAAKDFQESLHLGESLHKVFSSTLIQYADGYTPEFAEVYANLKRHLWQAPEDISMRTLELLLEEGQSCLDVFLNKVLKRIKELELILLETETYFKINVKDNAGDVLITGRIDALFKSAKGHYIILDFKTGKCPAHPLMSQMAPYIAMVNAAFGEDITVEAYAVWPQGKGHFVRYNLEDFEKDLQPLLSAARFAYTLKTFPKNQGPHCGFCPYQETCLRNSSPTENEQEFELF